MDCSPGIESHAMFLVQSPEELILKEIEDAAEKLLLERLAEAITQLSPTQARRLHARYTLEKKFREIAADEGISGSCACDSVTGALKKLQKIFAKNGWLEKEV
jgi:RNA polymerase sigma-70 factor (ECF subfamily)